METELTAIFVNVIIAIFVALIGTIFIWWVVQEFKKDVERDKLRKRRWDKNH